jgi:hypothetical protein
MLNKSWISESNISTNTQKNESLQLAIDYKYGDWLMRFVLMGWLFFESYTYVLMQQRPEALFAPINWFDKIFMPYFPNQVIWYAVWGTAFILNFCLIIKGELQWQRILLAFLVLWINCIRWKYEFFSHVGHVLVVYHFLGMFLIRKKNISTKDPDLIEYAKAIRWLYAGILMAYTFSGIWKIIGLIYKTVWHPDQINWLHPLAMKLNSIVGYRDWDMPLNDLNALYSVLLPWQIAFVLMLILQIISVFAAVRPQIKVYIALGNIVFHLVNAWLIHIEFFIAPLVLLTVFFPYHLVFKSTNRLIFTQKKGVQTYQRVYEDGAKDTFWGFRAWRAYKYDGNPLIYGLFYLPGLATTIGFFENRKTISP